MDIEDILDTATGQISVWLNGHTVTAARIVSWSRPDGLLICRGGNGFTDEDVHYIRATQIQGLTLRVPATRPESDRFGPEIREELRHAAGYPVSLAIYPGAFANDPSPLSAWLTNIMIAVAHLAPHREAIQSQIDQILLREGGGIAVLGGGTLILEATPAAIPEPEAIRAAIAALL